MYQWRKLVMAHLSYLLLCISYLLLPPPLLFILQRAHTLLPKWCKWLSNEHGIESLSSYILQFTSLPLLPHCTFHIFSFSYFLHIVNSIIFGSRTFQNNHAIPKHTVAALGKTWQYKTSFNDKHFSTYLLILPY